MTDIRTKVKENIVKPARAALENPDFIGDVPIPNVAILDYDNQRTTYTVEAVNQHPDGWLVSCERGVVLVTNAHCQVAPQVGEQMICFGPGVIVRGIVIGRRVYRYEPEEARIRKLAGWLASRRGEQVAAYNANQAAYDARVAALPAAFQQRITRFRSVRADWGYRFEGMELFVCEQAAALATVVADPEAWIHLEPAAKRAAFQALSSAHSSMSEFTMAALAAMYLNGEDLRLAHGAYCYATGCVEYGCPSAYPQTPGPGNGNGNLATNRARART